MMELLFIMFCAWVNRWRGGGWPGHLWGGPVIVPSVLLAGIATLCFGWMLGVIAGIGYLLWGLWGWGGYITMGRSSVPNRKEIAWIDAIVRPGLGYGWEGDAAGWALRQVYALPFFIAAALALGDPLRALLFFPFAVAVVGAYLLAFRLYWPGRWGISPTALAEAMTGASWGLVIAGYAA